MQKIVQMKFGSHLYGTGTPASDLDLKSVFLPSADDILLGRVKSVVSTSTGDPNTKNTADDVDDEAFALQKFLSMCADGQTVTIDMLFAPSEFWISATPLWKEIVANRHRLITRQSKSFVGYVRSQANKYGIRGSRVAAARAALELLSHSADGNPSGKVNLLAPAIERMVGEQQHMVILDIEGQSSTVRHWEVCGRKIPYTFTIGAARDIMQRVVNEYGHRARAAEQNQGVDWKAISHAVRIAEQAIELLTEGQVTFPRPNATRLLEIKGGKLEYQPIADELDRLLTEVEAAADSSTLPEEADRDWIDGLVKRAYGEVVRAG